MYKLRRLKGDLQLIHLLWLITMVCSEWIWNLVQLGGKISAEVWQGDWVHLILKHLQLRKLVVEQILNGVQSVCQLFLWSIQCYCSFFNWKMKHREICIYKIGCQKVTHCFLIDGCTGRGWKEHEVEGFWMGIYDDDCRLRAVCRME